jgi:hypothetical protein
LGRAETSGESGSRNSKSISISSSARLQRSSRASATAGYGIPRVTSLPSARACVFCRTRATLRSIPGMDLSARVYLPVCKNILGTCLSKLFSRTALPGHGPFCSSRSAHVETFSGACLSKLFFRTALPG